MPRIAHVISTPAGVGGAERVLESLCDGGRDRGWEQAVLNPFAQDPANAALRAHVADARYEGRRCGRPRDIPGVRRWLRGRLDAIDPDIVHVHLFHAAALTATLRRPQQRVLTQHHGDFLAQVGRRREAQIDRWAARRYDVVVAVSEWTARYLRGPRRLPADRVRTIANGWSGQPLERSTDPRPPTIVSVGNLRAEKNQESLLRSFAQVVERLPEAQLRIVGEGKERGRLEELAVTSGVAERVRFLGRVDPPWEELSRADLFASSSLVEPLGIAALEAMAAGLPVVAPRVGGLADLVDDGVTGVLVETGNDSQMAEALVDLLENRDRSREMGAAGALAAGRQRADDMVDSYFRLYEELIER